MADLKIGDKVLINKDGAPAVITKASSVEGKRQSQVECRRDDNGSVNQYWVDEVRLTKPASEPQQQVPEPVKEPEPRRTGSASTVAKATRVS